MNEMNGMVNVYIIAEDELTEKKADAKRKNNKKRKDFGKNVTNLPG